MAEPQLMILMTPQMFREEVEAAVRSVLDQAPKPAELMTSEELCARLSISKPTLRKYRLAGMPCVHVGTGYRFRHADALRWLETRG